MFVIICQAAINFKGFLAL